jgi:hypothetical protein
VLCKFMLCEEIFFFFLIFPSEYDEEPGHLHTVAY